jgi:hypothetical protein
MRKIGTSKLGQYNARRDRYIEWSHPAWDMHLLLPLDGSLGEPEDFLPAGASRDKLRVCGTEWMTQKEFEAVDEFTG